VVVEVNFILVIVGVLATAATCILLESF